ncbi:MAG TPA: FGGY-family carbohydrate kinase [Gaiellaceae bacterium]
MAGGQLLLGVDIGTYSAKAVLATPEGEVLAEAEHEHGLDLPRPGWAEHDPETIWWGQFVRLTRALLADSGRPGADVGAVAVSAIGPCLVPVDGHGRALRPGILYGIDTRATAEIAELVERHGAEEMAGLGGSLLTSQAVGPKLLWLRRHEPETFRAAAAFHSASDYVVLRLTGEHVMDAYTASLYDPLFDIEALAWSDRFAEGIVELDRLPPVRHATEVAGRVTDTAARETGLAAGTEVTVGTVDVVAEAVGVGTVRPGDLMCMYGTTAFFVLATERLVRHPAMWGVRHAFPGLYGVAAGMATSGALTRWFRDELARDLDPAGAYAALAKEAEQIPPGSLGLVVLPYFSGERTPIDDPDARGLVCGLTLAHSRAHLYRAVLEGTAYGMAHNLAVMREAGGRPARIVAVGGGARNPTWLQIVSDVSGVVQELPVRTTGAPYGDAFLAGWATGAVGSLDELHERWARIARTIEPDPARHELYRDYFDVYRALYEQTAAQQHALAELARRG